MQLTSPDTVLLSFFAFFLNIYGVISLKAKDHVLRLGKNEHFILHITFLWNLISVLQCLSWNVLNFLTVSYVSFRKRWSFIIHQNFTYLFAFVAQGNQYWCLGTKVTVSCITWHKIQSKSCRSCCYISSVTVHNKIMSYT